MTKEVTLSIRGRQTYLDQEPDIIELVTEGTLTRQENCWELCYEETALTGLEGVTTTFQVYPDKVALTRTGKLHSEMVFQVGVSHDSLYQMEFGTLMITVCASKMEVDLTEDGGIIDLIYGIEIEQSTAGVIDYHLEIFPRA